MAEAAGLVIAAGAIAAANEVLAAPTSGNLSDFNWRIVPATVILALLLEGLDKLEPGFGKGLAGLVLLSVFVIPYGNAPSPLTTAGNLLGNVNSKVVK
jgi:hypothetical protein